MTFHILTIFPHIADSYINESILKRAQEEGHITIHAYNIRDYSDNKHASVDDTPYGGGPGMVMSALPVIESVRSVVETIKDDSFHIVFFSPRSRHFDASTARTFASSHKHLILVCGRYEGTDARAVEVLKNIYGDEKVEELSIGDYVLTGGELPALVVIDAVSRHIPQVLGEESSLEENRNASHALYTRPQSFTYEGKAYNVPDVLISGNHKDIEEWRRLNKNPRTHK